MRFSYETSYKIANLVHRKMCAVYKKNTVSGDDFQFLM